jgi:hypothetical protein
MRLHRLKVALFSLAVLIPNAAAARTTEAGSTVLGAMIGPGFKLGSTLGGSSAYLLTGVQAEYVFDKSLSAVADLSVGLAGTVPVRFHAGARYRFSDLELPISPYIQGQVTIGRLNNVLGATLPYLGLRVGAGADYFLTSNIAVGALAAVDMGSTTGDRPAFYGTVDVLAYATYRF